MPNPILTRLLRKMRKESDGCWQWTAAKTGSGYGALKIDGRMVSAHRLAYELFVGPIPDGFQIDHLCRNRTCVNPAHMEPVTAAENIRRGFGIAGENARKTRCCHGHLFTSENTYLTPDGRRNCRQCRSEAKRAYERRQRAKRGAISASSATL